MDGAALARDCVAERIALSAMDVVLDRVRDSQRQRGSEHAFSVRDRAAGCGRGLST
ncbi:hypothetical protein ABZ023_27350 [Streptomyces sp. NPDC006367]|uniref:hypothetical protein n=1 Tax=unclassified Streptomyces TaxID=2593676 RepID=UPI0033A80DA2